MHINGPLPQQSLPQRSWEVLYTNCGALFRNICIANWDYDWLQLAQVPVALFSHNKNYITWCQKELWVTGESYYHRKRSLERLHIHSNIQKYICHMDETQMNSGFVHCLCVLSSFWPEHQVACSLHVKSRSHRSCLSFHMVSYSQRLMPLLLFGLRGHVVIYYMLNDQVKTNKQKKNQSSSESVCNLVSAIQFVQ